MRTARSNLILAGAAVALNACSTLPSASSTHFLRHYPGAAQPQTEIAILKAAPPPAAARAYTGVELHGIDSRRFRGAQGFGAGEYEIHFWPGEYTLYLQPSDADSGRKSSTKAAKARTVEFTFTAKKGHSYVLAGERYIDAASGEERWRPVLFDKTRVISWQRRDDAPARPGTALAAD